MTDLHFKHNKVYIYIRYSAGNSLLTVLNDWKIRAKLSIYIYIYIYIYRNFTNVKKNQLLHCATILTTK